ncbi:MAG: ribonuclease H-like domain-containing protein [Candidatus Bathyarchaeia archaeon]
MADLVKLFRGGSSLIDADVFRFDGPMVGFDVETYSPYGFPADRRDPIVTATLAISPSFDMSRGLVLVSMTFPPEMEEALLRLLRDYLGCLSGSLVTYNGERFDLPYTAYRASLYGLDFKEAYAGYRSLDVYRLARRMWMDLPSYRQKSVEGLLGLGRLVEDVDGSNYHEAFQGFLSDGDVKPVIYNIEDSVGCLRILKRMVAKVLSNE